MTLENLYKLFLQYPIISTDTRKIAKNSLFFALKGPNYNANFFAKEALEKGAAFAIVDDFNFAINDQYIVVENVLLTLQQLAKMHRNAMSIPVIAIVGSNGKTTTKELLTSILKQEMEVHATPGNFNNHIGLPLTLLNLNTTHQIAIIEMGANHIGENAELCEIANPSIGIITNNGKDHLEGFGTIEGVAQSNSELYYYLLKNNGLAFVNANDEWLMRMANRLNKKITYCANHKDQNTTANFIGIATYLQPEIIFTYSHNLLKNNIAINSCLSGDYNFDNIMAAVAISKHIGITDANIKKGIEQYEPTNNRSQVLKKEHNTIFLDAYNANPSSMEASLKNFAAMPFNNKIAIIGDMLEMGNYAKQEHQNIADFCNTLNLEKVWLIGSEFSQTIAPNMLKFNTTADAIEYLIHHPFIQKNILMKASRGLKLETLVEYM